jgi:hypothetical protein
VTSKRPTRDSFEGRAYLDLQNAARRAGRDTSEYLAFYALEGFLARLGQSRFAKVLVLKGGVLLAVYATRRPTRDIDLQATGLSNEVDDVVALAREIAALPRDDGLVFDLESVSGRDIRDEDPYAGIRVSIMTRLATALITFHVDVNFGDPIWPEPTGIELPLLLGGQMSLLGYPVHMVLAEKIVTAVERGTANTRWRDFIDIVSVGTHTDIAGDDLEQGLRVVAAHRQVALTPLRPLLKEFGRNAQPKWRAWRRKQRLESITPADFHDLVEACCRLADPAILGRTSGRIWRDGAWTPNIWGAESSGQGDTFP